jgi:hypothetical protein
MFKNPLILILILCSLLFSCQNISDNNTDLCGNGIIELNEECDEVLPHDITCSSINPNFPNGVVSCDSTCRFDLTKCEIPLCGDGIRHKGEICDATDLGNELCKTVGLFNTGELICDNTCNFDVSNCSYQCNIEENFVECDPFGGDSECCPRNNMKSTCAASYGDGSARCLQTCDLPAECGWNLSCNINEHTCNYLYCSNDLNNTEINTECNLFGERKGWCYPMGNAMDSLGVCLQNGTATHDATCSIIQDVDGELNIENSSRCDKGVCVSSGFNGTCLDYCDPIATYKTGQDPCPSNYNCLNFSDIDLEESDNGQINPGFLFRTAEVGICYPSFDDMNPSITEGVLTCDILTNSQLKIPTHPPCPSGTGCKRIMFGSLMGGCTTIKETPLPLKSPCEISDMSNRPCETGTECFIEDPFNDPTPSNPQWSCINYCDADLGQENNIHCNGLTTDDGTPLICLTLSRFFSPDHQLPTVGQPPNEKPELSPSPLGFCVPPKE